MKIVTDSTIEFVMAVRRLFDGERLALGSIDFDHAGYFLNVYGALPTYTVVEACRAWVESCLEDQGIDAYALLQSSPDEMLIVCRSSAAEVLVASLRRAQELVAIEGRRGMPDSPYAMGFTSVIAEE